MNANEDKKVFDFDIMRLVFTLLKRWWIIVLAALICAGLVTAYAYSTNVPTYTSDAMIFVNNAPVSIGSSAVTISASQLSAAQSLLKVYTVILNSRSTLDEINKAAGTRYSYGALRSMISAGSVDGTAVYKIVVTANNPNIAYDLCQAVVDVLPGIINETITGTIVKTVDTPLVSSTPTSRGLTKSFALGFVLGCVLSAGVIILIEILNDKLQSEDWLVNAYGDTIPLLSVIPDVETSGGLGYRSRYGYGYTSRGHSGDGTKNAKSKDGGDK